MIEAVRVVTAMNGVFYALIKVLLDSNKEPLFYPVSNRAIPWRSEKE